MGDREVQPTDAELSPAPFTAEERAEFEEWQKLGHNSWQMIDRWEAVNEPVVVRGGGHGD